MRLRAIKGAKEHIQAYPEFVLDITDAKKVEDVSVATFPKQFTKDQPLHIEIGMGKGQFIHSMAKQYPNINFVGIERYDSVLYRALEKMIEEPLDNLFLLRMDATFIQKVFGDTLVDKIFLNFSDPWPKTRHEKRRLTHPGFLAQYQAMLKPSGVVELKTDNTLLYQYSKSVIEEYPMEIVFQTEHLHQEPVENLMTEFEEKFAQEGKHIYKIIAKFKEDIHG